MNIEPIPHATVSREMRSIAAGLVQRLLADGGNCSRVLLRLGNDRLFLALLIADGYGPARMLLGPHDEEELTTPTRVELDDLEVDTVAEAIQEGLTDACSDDFDVTRDLASLAPGDDFAVLGAVARAAGYR
jgi:hypothetical protein